MCALVCSVADVAFDGDGAIYIGDGDGGVNNRVVKVGVPAFFSALLSSRAKKKKTALLLSFFIYQAE